MHDDIHKFYFHPITKNLTHKSENNNIFTFIFLFLACHDLIVRYTKFMRNITHISFCQLILKVQLKPVARFFSFSRT